ncbi:hypothetical protein ABMA70_14215 [Halobacteriovorax sp. XZX-3]|uniref:hypothetical protein n=1 Tax=unclassified Halobacteriovorax TaxID=2639665 RepID=UPI000CD1BDCB|nr:hypothetical protein [Halobacteriovorax sp. DA5]POB13369.1 hypothetical protein C0Z22_09400 [Halobacteriovorax sp. DA5]
MKKSLIALGLLCSVAASTQASCLELYKERNNAPTDKALATGAALSTTGVAVIYGGVELASTTIAAGTALLEDSGNIIIDLIALDIIEDGLSSSTHAVYHGSSSTLAATGVIDDSKRNFRGQIELIQDAQLSPKVTGSTLAEFTEDLNDRRSSNDKVTAEQVADEIRVADARGEFCMDVDDMMSMSEIRNYINNQL